MFSTEERKKRKYESNKVYRAANLEAYREKVRKYSKAHYAANREFRREKARLYYAANREKALAYSKGFIANALHQTR